MGLTAVWLVGGMSIAWRDKRVDIPAASEDVLYVFPDTALPGHSGGGGYTLDGSCPPYAFPDKKATLAQVKTIGRGDLRFRFSNDTGCDLYMAYSIEDPTTREGYFPYWMVCPDKTGRVRPVTYYDSVPAMEVLSSGDYFVFTADRPSSKGRCTISVGYHRDSRVLDLANGPDPFSIIAPENKLLIDNSLRRSELTFKP